MTGNKYSIPFISTKFYNNEFLHILIIIVAANFILSDKLAVHSLENSEKGTDSSENFVTKCFGELGCFYTGPPWFHPQYRPISVAPEDNITSKYYLFTHSNPNKSFALKPTQKSLRQSPYRKDVPTKILVHGYVSNHSDFKGVREELLSYGDFNVINVDWSSAAKPPYYQAVANLRVVAAKVAQLVQFLMDEADLKPEHVHLVGHSLGAQLVGLAGQRIGNISRITGLDPAGPYFYDGGKEIRIDPTDADYVDIIHSNSGHNMYTGEGLNEILGHTDFFPNGGNHQPGCNRESSYKISPVGIEFDNSCSHGRSIVYFQQSIRNCQYIAYGCPSYEDFLNYNCKTHLRNQMGFHSTKPEHFSLKYFLNTHSNPPYCEVEYSS